MLHPFSLKKACIHLPPSHRPPSHFLTSVLRSVDNCYGHYSGSNTSLIVAPCLCKASVFLQPSSESVDLMSTLQINGQIIMAGHAGQTCQQEGCFNSSGPVLDNGFRTLFNLFICKHVNLKIRCEDTGLCCPKKKSNVFSFFCLFPPKWSHVCVTGMMWLVGTGRAVTDPRGLSDMTFLT